MSDYTPTIGIECHVQLKTKSKLFAAVDNDAREAPPNTLISHICVGMPGALPVLNEAAIELSSKAALVLNTKPQAFSRFERKHYFYPDLPKGYQITQLEDPIIKGGYVEIEVDGEPKKIGIERANLEEDAGKNTHPEGADFSLVDLNRAGTPLLEIVSKPELHSAVEAKAYARELWRLMKYADVTDGDLYHGHVRFDVNVSLSKDDKLGTRTEMKNLNSFRSVEMAIQSEIDRQAELLDKGEKIAQETRGWDEAKQKSTSQRGKEEVQDYRYMPEPDIPPVELDNTYIAKIEKTMSQSVRELREKLNMLSIEAQVVDDLLDQPEATKRIVQVLDKSDANHARRVAFQLIDNPEALKLSFEDQLKIADMAESGEVSSTAAKSLLAETIIVGGDPEAVAQKLGLAQVSDEDELGKIVEKVISDNPKVVEDIKSGQEKAIGFLVGQVMAATKGQANPGIVQKLIRQKIS